MRPRDGWLKNLAHLADLGGVVAGLLVAKAMHDAASNFQERAGGHCMEVLHLQRRRYISYLLSHWCFSLSHIRYAQSMAQMSDW